jgi:hypothetical protein
MDSYAEAVIKVYDTEQVSEPVNLYNKETCNFNECESIGTEEIEVKAGDQVLTLLLCKLHVGDFENDKLIAEEENGA